MAANYSANQVSIFPQLPRLYSTPSAMLSAPVLELGQCAGLVFRLCCELQTQLMQFLSGQEENLLPVTLEDKLGGGRTFQLRVPPCFLLFAVRESIPACPPSELVSGPENEGGLSRQAKPHSEFPLLSTPETPHPAPQSPPLRVLVVPLLSLRRELQPKRATRRPSRMTVATCCPPCLVPR